MSYFFLYIALIFCTTPFLCEANWNLPQVTSSAISPREERKENEICGIGYINFVLSWSFKKLNNRKIFREDKFVQLIRRVKTETTL